MFDQQFSTQMSDHVRDIVAGIGWLKSGGVVREQDIGSAQCPRRLPD
jgi:hypothetical protein